MALKKFNATLREYGSLIAFGSLCCGVVIAVSKVLSAAPSEEPQTITIPDPVEPADEIKRSGIVDGKKHPELCGINSGELKDFLKDRVNTIEDWQRYSCRSPEPRAHGCLKWSEYAKRGRFGCRVDSHQCCPP